MTTVHKRPQSEDGTFWVIVNPGNNALWLPDSNVFCAFTSSDLALMAVAELELEGYGVARFDWPTLVENYGSYFEKVLIDYFPDTFPGHLFDLKL